MGPGDLTGDFGEGAFIDGYEFGHAAFHAVADGLGMGAESFMALETRVAHPAGVGEEGDNVIAGV